MRSTPTLSDLAEETTGLRLWAKCLNGVRGEVPQVEDIKAGYVNIKKVRSY